MGLGDDGRIRFVQADLAQLTLDAPVDAVFSTATFHWVLDYWPMNVVATRAS